METFIEYLRLNEKFHHALRDLAKSPQLERALEHVLALPFGRRARSDGRHATLPESWEILLVAQHQHQALIEAIRRREGARADAILASTHASRAENLDIALRDRQLLERVPGRRCCASRPLSS